MYSDVPNLASAFGYTNASWTLKCDLTCEYVCRLINYMDRHNYRQCMPHNADPAIEALPSLDFSSGYVQRSVAKMPKQGSKRPWRLYQNYALDIVRSTEKAARLGDSRWTQVMKHYYAAVRRELKTLRGKEVVTTGDGLLATFGAPAAGVRCASAIREAVRTLGLEIRVGLHAGEYKVSGAEVFGLAFHIGARVAAKARPGEVLVSSAVKDLMSQSGIRFKDRGVHQLKGVPERWRLYRVER